MGVGGAFLGRGGYFWGYPPLPPPKTPKKGVFGGGPKNPKKWPKMAKNASMSGLVHLLFAIFSKNLSLIRGGVGGVPPPGTPPPGGSPQRFFAKPYVDSVELDQTHTDTPSSDFVWSYSPISNIKLTYSIN